MKCDICQDSRRVRLPVRAEFAEFSVEELLSDQPPGWKEFDCPQCAMVPFRRVRAMKVATAYEAEQFGKYQMPIERGLAARFGEYLMREGLLRFSTSGSTDNGPRADKITITAHLGVVTREDTRRAGANAEVALTPPPPLPAQLTRQEQRRLRLSGNATRWIPPPATWGPPDEPVTDEFDEPKDAIGARFSGLEI